MTRKIGAGFGWIEGILGISAGKDSFVRIILITKFDSFLTNKAIEMSSYRQIKKSEKRKKRDMRNKKEEKRRTEDEKRQKRKKEKKVGTWILIWRIFPERMLLDALVLARYALSPRESDMLGANARWTKR